MPRLIHAPPPRIISPLRCFRRCYLEYRPLLVPLTGRPEGCKSRHHAQHCRSLGLGWLMRRSRSLDVILNPLRGFMRWYGRCVGRRPPLCHPSETPGSVFVAELLDKLSRLRNAADSQRSQVSERARDTKVTRTVLPRATRLICSVISTERAACETTAETANCNSPRVRLLILRSRTVA